MSQTDDGLGDEVADREDETVVADHDAVARAIGAEDRRGERVVRNLGAQSDDAVERRLEIEGDFALRRLQRRRERPAGEVRHGVAFGAVAMRLVCARHASNVTGLSVADGMLVRARTHPAIILSRATRAHPAASAGQSTSRSRRDIAMHAPTFLARCLVVLVVAATSAPAQVAPRRHRTRGLPGLFAAAARGDARSRSRGSPAGADLGARDGHGRTPLHVAAFAGAARRDARARRGRRRSECARERPLRHRHDRRRRERRADAEGRARARRQREERHQPLRRHRAHRRGAPRPRRRSCAS